MRVDTTDAVEMFETLGWATKEAGIGKYAGFLLVEALRTKGYRLILEQLPIEVDQSADDTKQAADLMDELPLPSPEAVRALRESGLTWAERQMITQVPREVMIRLAGEDAQWPKLVTRIDGNGHAVMVRYP